jgi:hypothetical protein
MGTSLIVVEPIDKDIAILLDEELSPKAQSVTLADFARQCLAEAQATNQSALGYLPPLVVTVDGVAGRSEDQVRPDGAITYEFQLISDVLVFVDQQLIAHSPVLTGRYQRSHVLYADGAETDPENPAQASEYVFLNTQPYARKIEKGLSPSTPDGVYEGVATQARGRFGNMAKISFEYRAAPSGAVTDWAGTESAARHASRHYRHSQPNQQAWLSRQPAIVVTAV